MTGRAKQAVTTYHSHRSCCPTEGRGLTSLNLSRLYSFCKYRNLLIDETMTPCFLRVAACLLPLLIVVSYKIWTIIRKYSRTLRRHYTNDTIAAGTLEYWTQVPSRSSTYQHTYPSRRRPHHCTDSPIQVDIDITPLFVILPLGVKIVIIGAGLLFAFYRVSKIHNPDRRFLGL